MSSCGSKVLYLQISELQCRICIFISENKTIPDMSEQFQLKIYQKYPSRTVTQISWLKFINLQGQINHNVFNYPIAIQEIFHKYLLLCEDVLQLYGLHIRRLTGLNSAKSSLKLCTVNTLFLFPPPIASSSSCLKFPIPTAYVLIPRAMAAFAAAIVTRFRTYCKNSPDN